MIKKKNFLVQLFFIHLLSTNPFTLTMAAPDYGGPSEEISQEMAIFMKQTFRTLLENFQNSERTLGQIIGEFIVNLMKLPFAVVYAIAAYNPTVAHVIYFFYVVIWWYLLVSLVIFAYFIMENIYKTFVSSRLALLGRLRPWGIVHKMLGIRDTLKNDIHSRVVTNTDHFTVNEVQVPMSGLLLQIMIASVVDIVVGAAVSLTWPITTSVFIITTLFTFKAPSVFYTYTLVEGEKIHNSAEESFMENEDEDEDEEEED